MKQGKPIANVTSAFRFDAALSFDRNDRETGKLLADAIRSAGLLCFIDEEHEADLWGKDESEFARIYGPDSRFVIPLVSKEYVNNIWTRHEFELAKREAKKRDHVYILPIRMDDTPLLGLPEGTIYQFIDKTSPAKIAELLKQKIDKIFGNGTGTKPGGITILSSDERLALGILVTAAFPRQVEYYCQLFPLIDWKVLLPRLNDLGLVSASTEIPTVPPQVEVAFPRNSSEIQQLENKWIEVLEPLQGHIDIVPALAIHLMRADRFADAAEALAKIAAGIELGWWNGIYLSALELIVKKTLKSLPQETRFETLNAYGICLSRDDRLSDAVKAFQKLRSSARRAKNDYWVGQSLINEGVAEFHRDNVKKSIRLYEHARCHGEDAEDWHLVGRCLGNLAESFRDTNPAKSRAMLSESIKLKKRLKDDFGLATAEVQLGNLETGLGQPAKAIPHFFECVKRSDKCDDMHLKSLALFNLANANYELGQNRKAISYYAKSLKIADEYRYGDCLHYSAIGMGRAAFEAGKFNDAKSAFEILLESAEDNNAVDDKMCSLHALAVIENIMAGETAAKPLFSRAIRFARVNGLGEWYARCISDRTRQNIDDSFNAAELVPLERTARQFRKKNDNEFAGQLFFQLARQLSVYEDAPLKEVTNAFNSAESCLQKSGNQVDRLQVLLEFSDWQWQQGEFLVSIESMCRAELLAIDIGQIGRACESADQIGVRMQHLGRFHDAIVCHRRAVKLARQHELILSLEAFLNNLGEALRHTKQFDDAEIVFFEAEQIGSAINEQLVISTAHNRALTYQDSGDHDRAESLFKQIRDQARRLGIWKEYVRAIEALATLAWVQGKRGLSRSRYLDAIRVAKKKSLIDSLPWLALNYAELEISLGKPNLAIREIRRVIHQVTNSPEEHLYHQVLGRACAAEKPETAIAPLEKAAELAQKIGDNENGLRALAELATVFEQLNRYDKACETLDRIVNHESNPEMQVSALDQLLKLQLSKDDDAAQSTFDRATALIEKHRLHGSNAAIHLSIGIHYWTRDDAKKLEALQAFIVAVTFALIRDTSDSDRGTDDSMCGKVTCEIVRLLTNPDSAIPAEELAVLVDEVTPWVNKQIRDKFWRKIALTPIHLAQDLLPLNDQPRKFVKEIDRLIESGKYFR